jgi:DNA-binding protein H-NS
MEHSMSNLLDIQSQIQKLQKQANEIKSREFDKTVQDILVQMEAFGITVKDLQNAKPAKAAKGRRGRPAADKAAPAKKRSAKSANPVAAKYRGPNGETWSGRGLTPRWLATLVTEGRNKEEFALAS